jgi:hypothetical protein
MASSSVSLGMMPSAMATSVSHWSWVRNSGRWGAMFGGFVATCVIGRREVDVMVAACEQESLYASPSLSATRSLPHFSVISVVGCGVKDEATRIQGGARHYPADGHVFRFLKHDDPSLGTRRPIIR